MVKHIYLAPKRMRAKPFWAILSLGYMYHCSAEMVELGDKKSECVWIYLCGLAKDFDIPEAVANRKLLDEIGKKLGIRFVAIKPNHRKPKFDHKLCWYFGGMASSEVEETYRYIVDHVKNNQIAGLIGFSNGGFFLNKLIQVKSLSVPIITIGSGGYFRNGTFPNHTYLLIGKNDVHHYTNAKQFYTESKGTALRITFIEYEGGHRIPKSILLKVLYDCCSRHAKYLK